MVRYKVTSGPAAEPLTAAEVKDHLRLETDDDDSYIEKLIVAARNYAENELRYKLITQTITWLLDEWPRDFNDGLGWWDGVKEGSILSPHTSRLDLPIGPVQSVTSVTSYNTEDAPVVWDASQYIVDTHLGRLVARSGASIPVTSRQANGLEVVYVAGYGDTATDVPMGIRVAMMQLIAHWYERREPIAMVMGYGFTSLPAHFDRLFRQFKLMRI